MKAMYILIVSCLSLMTEGHSLSRRSQLTRAGRDGDHHHPHHDGGDHHHHEDSNARAVIVAGGYLPSIQDDSDQLPGYEASEDEAVDLQGQDDSSQAGYVAGNSVEGEDDESSEDLPVYGGANGGQGQTGSGDLPTYVNGTTELPSLEDTTQHSAADDLEDSAQLPGYKGDSGDEVEASQPVYIQPPADNSAAGLVPPTDYTVPEGSTKSPSAKQSPAKTQPASSKQSRNQNSNAGPKRIGNSGASAAGQSNSLPKLRTNQANRNNNNGNKAASVPKQAQKSQKGQEQGEEEVRESHPNGSDYDAPTNGEVPESDQPKESYTVAAEGSTDGYTVAAEGLTDSYTVAAEGSTDSYTVSAESDSEEKTVAKDNSSEEDDSECGDCSSTGKPSGLAPSGRNPSTKSTSLNANKAELLSLGYKGPSFPFYAVENTGSNHCPGGTLESCVAVCPGETARVYAACVTGCGNRCTL